MAERYLNKHEGIAPEELKAKGLNEIQTKGRNFSLKREHDVNIENCLPQELEKALQKFYVEVCNFVMTMVNN